MVIYKVRTQITVLLKNGFIFELWRLTFAVFYGCITVLIGGFWWRV
ncbi:MAG: hypothetical protein ACI8WW_002695, partial [Oceanospirillaceae bacterium]